VLTPIKNFDKNLTTERTFYYGLAPSQ
jgi:hypothetical protein